MSERNAITDNEGTEKHLTYTQFQCNMITRVVDVDNALECKKNSNRTTELLQTHGGDEHCIIVSETTGQ